MKDCDIRALLERLKKIECQNDDRDAFNIFKILGIETKELLICRLIGALLEPNGAHGLGTKPLELFFEFVLKRGLTAPERAYVLLEEQTDESRRIDIVIHTQNGTYPIEAKIEARDRDAQLCHYYRYCFGDRTDKKIYYLTPTGWEPSAESRGDLGDDNIVRLSFQKDIKGWIGKMLKESEPMQPILKQFSEVIDVMCAKSKELSDLKKALNLGNGSFESKELKAAILLLNHKDDIMKQIRTDYLMKYLACGDGYEKIPIDGDKNIDDHALVAILKDGQAVAYACVDTNLYLCCKKIKETRGWGDWKKGRDDYWWTYIRPEGGDTKYDMRTFPDIIEKDIDIRTCLNDIEL